MGNFVLFLFFREVLSFRASFLRASAGNFISHSFIISAVVSVKFSGAPTTPRAIADAATLAPFLVPVLLTETASSSLLLPVLLAGGDCSNRVMRLSRAGTALPRLATDGVGSSGWWPSSDDLIGGAPLRRPRVGIMKTHLLMGLQ